MESEEKTGDVPTADEIRLAMEAICQSHWFLRAPLVRDLFVHMLEETLAGRTPTERSVAKAVWTIDQLMPGDSRIRGRKGKLCEALKQYYEGPGKAAPIRFAVDEFRIVITSPDFGSNATRPARLEEAPPASEKKGYLPLSPADPERAAPEAPQPVDPSRHWFDQACDAARLNDDTQVVLYLQKASDAGHSLAMTHLGMMYRRGRGGLPKDEVKSAQWFREAADKGEARAMYELGVMCERGQGEAAMQPPPMAEDDSVLKAVVKTVSAIAARAISRLPVRPTKKPEGEEGDESVVEDHTGLKSAFPDDAPSALNWIQEAADLGDPFALTLVGTMHFDGFGVPKDEARAAHYFLKAAPHGELFALTALAAMYFTGRGGLQEDHSRGHDHFTQSGIVANAERLNIFQRTNQVFLNNNDMYAARWFRKALDHEPRAMSRLGAMYAGGRPALPRDDERAVYWFRNAANLSEPLGMACFGVMHAGGRGGLPQNKIYAAHWFRKAAEAGEVLGMVALAVMLGNRHDGPSQDEVQALHWLRASGLPEPYAKAALDYVTGAFAPHACTRLLRTSLMFTR